MLPKYFVNTTVSVALCLGVMTLVTGCATENTGQTPELAGTSSRGAAAVKPEQILVPPDMRPMQPAEQGPRITPTGVPAEVSEPEAIYHSDETMEDPPQIPEHEVPGPAGKRKRGFGVPLPEGTIIGSESEPTPLSWTGSSTGFISTDFDENGDYTGGYRFIPPDCSAATGPDHVVNVVNVTIAFHKKDGTQVLQQSLESFFTLASPPAGYTNPESFTFDPKVIYDQYAQRYLVVTLEHIDNGPSDEQSRIYVAVSDDADPTGNWYVTSIDAKTTIGGNEYWADYPGFAMDDEAVYITNNMFGFNDIGGAWGGVRLWIIDKGETGGFYANNTATVTIHDPYAGGGISTTTQPAHTFGTVPAGVGTFLVSYSGLSNGNEFMQIVRVDNPLTAPSFSQQYVLAGNIENTGRSMPNAPQLGSADEIETNDRRALNSVWRDNKLWLATTILGSGTDARQATAYWVAMDTNTLSALSIDDQGQIDGEDIATGTHTFFPAIAVNSREDVVIGFSASAPSIYPGAYFTTRAIADSAGSTGPSRVVQAGTDYYYRTFGGSRNRWGDYSGASVDPVTECFWVYNEFAMNRGTTINLEDGRWGTAYSETCPCTNSYSLTANQWKMFSLSCNVGSDNSVADVFGDDLPVAEYDSTWIVFRRDEATDSYEQMTLSDTLEEGRSYWITTTDSGKSVTIKGIHNDLIEVPLISESSSGVQNMVGHPFNSDVNWQDVKVIYGASELSLALADPEDVNQIRACEDSPVRDDCVMSRVMHKWNGSSYDPYDGETLGMEGTLNPMDGFWVKAFKNDGSNLALRVQTSLGSAPLYLMQHDVLPVSLESAATSSEAGVKKISTDPAKSNMDTGTMSSPDGWFIRLIAEAGQMRDGGNVLGQLPDSVHGYDKHDLKEMPPFDNKHYLTIIFPHEDWGMFSGDYASDFHSLSQQSGDIWYFTVKSSDDVKDIALSFEGTGELLEQARLIVLDGDGKKIESLRIREDQEYHFTINNNSRSFKIETLMKTNILLLVVPVQAKIHKEKMKKK
jgi:hypothetical protein